MNTILHTRSNMRRTWFNRAFALVCLCSIITLLRARVLDLLHSQTAVTSLLMLVSDVILALMWLFFQAFRLNPIRREVFIENLPQVVKDEGDYLALDVFICTADPHKEPPIGVVNTALSAMAFDYPTDKLSVYVSDDGGSELTLFAFIEAAKFAKHWLPFCKKNGIVDRCPHAYFDSDPIWLPEFEGIKAMYKSMKDRIETAVERGSLISSDYGSNEETRQIFSKWTENFTRSSHPAVIQILLDSDSDKDNIGHQMPKLVYVSREKSKDAHHHFKAGALNVLLRVSAIMSNALIILTLDCDMYSNDPTTPLRALCYYLDPKMESTLGWVQFPQMFKGINETDIYASELKYEVKVNPSGMDGILGPTFMGSGCFFKRRVFFGGPFSGSDPEMLKKNSNKANGLAQAHSLASCRYEAGTKWGSDVGFRYGSLVEDVFTGFRIQCLGWRSVLCNPKRGAFLGNVPTNLYDTLNQLKRWCMGLLDIFFSKYNPLIYGTCRINLLQCFCYSYYSLWAILALPITIYSFLPQVALIHSLPIFPKVSDTSFLLYALIFMGSNAQTYLELNKDGATFAKWWSNQRMWIIRGISCFPFALSEYILDCIGMSSFGYNVTSKVVDNEENKRYELGIIDFGVASPIFIPLAMAAIVNLLSFSIGVKNVLKNGKFDDLFGQIFVSGYFVVNLWPVYDAMFIRRDKGKMAVKITLFGTIISWILIKVSSFTYSP